MTSTESPRFLRTSEQERKRETSDIKLQFKMLLQFHLSAESDCVMAALGESRPLCSFRVSGNGPAATD